MKPEVVIVGLGPAGPDLVTAGTLAAIDRVEHRFLRTTRHPSASLVRPCQSFDSLEDDSVPLDEVHRRMVDTLVTAAEEHGRILYAVPGSPFVAERTVEILVTDDRVRVDVMPALSFAHLSPVAAELGRFAELVRRLREECPWDRQQTHSSLKRYLLEETYEVLEAIDGLDPETGEGFEHLEEELGDLLFQVFFHAAIAAQGGRFDVADVARVVHDKLHSRHPHVFGDVEVADADEVRRNWEQIKRSEKKRESVMEGVPRALPALAYAAEVQRKAGGRGLSLGGADAARYRLEELVEDLHPEATGDEIGAVLFAVVQAARESGVDAEDALRTAAARFRVRFETLERNASDRGLDLDAMSDDEMVALWAEADPGATGSSG